MSEQAEVLRDMIDFFKIDFDESAVPEETAETASENAPSELDIPVFDSDETTAVDSELDFDNIGSISENTEEASASDENALTEEEPTVPQTDDSETEPTEPETDISETDDEIIFEPSTDDENKK